MAQTFLSVLGVTGRPLGAIDAGTWNEVTRLTAENQQLSQRLAANVDVATVAGQSAAAAVAPATD